MLFFYAELLHGFTTIPLADDYTALLKFATEWRFLPTLPQRFLHLLAAQDGDYKLLLDHAAVALDMALTGRIHLAAYLLLGNLLLLVVLWTLWQSTTPNEPVLWRRLLLFTPVTFLLFQLNYAETLDWAMGGLQNLAVIAFAFLSLHLLLRNSIPAASIAAILACCGSANGFLLLPIGTVLLLRRRNWSMLLCWCASFAIAAAAYLYRLDILPKKRVGLPALLHFLLSFLGGGVENMSGKPIAGASLMLGLALLLFLAYVFFRRIDRAAPFAACACIWVLLTAALVTLGRSGFGANFALSGRYKIYADLLLVFAYLFALTLRRRRTGPGHTGKSLFTAALLGSIAMCIASDIAGVHLLQQRRARLQADIATYLRSNGTASPMQDTSAPPHVGYTPIEIAARDILNAARAQGIYTLPMQ